MNLLIRNFFLLTICLAHHVVCAQLVPSTSWRHYTSRDGLPSTQVSSAFEDQQGNIWFTTDRGAAKFDGYSFRTYGTTDGLPHNNVLIINQDHKGRIWFMSSNGAFSYLEGDTIIHYGGNEKIKSIVKRMPASLYFDEGDTLWITNITGDQLLKCYGDSVSEFVIPESLEKLHPTFYLRKVGEKLVSLRVGNTGENNELLLNDKITYLLSIAGECKLGCSAQVAENRWVLAGPNTYVVFDEQGNIRANFDQSPYLFGSMDKDKSGNLWITNSNGAYRLRNYEQDPASGELFFEGHFITSVLEDKVGNYWFTDRDNGVFFVPNINVRVVRSFVPSKQNKITSVKQIENHVYFSDASGQIYLYTDSAANPILKQTPPSGVSLDFGKINETEFVVGNLPCIYNVTSGTIKTTGETSTIRDCVPDPKGGVAFALSDGVGFMSPSGQWFDLDSAGYKERSNCVYFDRNGVLWIGANSGLYKWNGHEIENLTLKHPELEARIMDIESIGNDGIIVATRTKGVIVISGEKIIELSEKNGLVSNLVDCITKENDHTWWLGTGMGLTRITLEDLYQEKFSFYQLDYKKGLPSNEVNDVVVMDGKIYVATNDGFAALDVGNIAPNTVTPELSIVLVAVNNKEVNYNEPLELKYFETNIRIDFNAICFRNGGKTLYRYRMDGDSGKWITTFDRSVQFMSLAPGTYNFEVSAMNEDGYWNETPARVSFTIAMHFTKTWWFRLLLVLGVGGVVGGIALFYFRLQRKQHEVQTKMNELKQQALNANMNPHFIFNALNSIQHYINQNNHAEANEYMSHFSKLIRMNMETTRHSLVPLEDELERLELYLKLEKSRFGDNLTYSINVKNVEVYETMIPPMLLQPYVENAIWHGILPTKKTGYISVEVDAHGTNEYKIEIIDNGVGINKSLESSASKSHKSMSMDMNQERLRLLSRSTGKQFSLKVSDISDTFPDLNGTKVSFILPKDIVVGDLEI